MLGQWPGANQASGHYPDQWGPSGQTPVKLSDIYSNTEAPQEWKHGSHNTKNEFHKVCPVIQMPTPAWEEARG